MHAQGLEVVGFEKVRALAYNVLSLFYFSPFSNSCFQ
jgi:hypothetical protein